MGASNFFETEIGKIVGKQELSSALDRDMHRSLEMITRAMEEEVIAAARAVILRRVRKMAEEIPLSITIRGHGAK